MNNGSFFPNIDQNQGIQTQPASLNSMNTQAMVNPVSNNNYQQETNPLPSFLGTPENKEENVNTVPISPMPEPPTVVPSIAPSMPEVPIVEPTIEPTPVSEEKPAEIPVVSPVIEENPIQPTPTPVIPSVPVVDPPLPEEPVSEVVQETKVESPPEPEISTPLVDTPLFNTSAEPTPIPEQTYEVPVTPNPPQPEAEPVTKVQEFLEQNGIAYKKYSNETGNCIIIEL